jgi:hypothetical protein
MNATGNGNQTDWIQIAVTVAAGVVISLVVAYFQSDWLRSQSKRLAERTLVWTRDYPISTRYVPLLLGILLALWQLSNLTVTDIAVVYGVWASAVLLRMAYHRPRGGTVIAFNASDPSSGSLELLGQPGDASTDIVKSADGHAVLRSDPTTGRDYFYFRFTEQKSHRYRAASTVVFVVEFWHGHLIADRSTLGFRLGFDQSADAPFKKAFCQGVAGDQPWRLALFQTFGAEFRRRQQECADFRVDIDGDRRLLVRNVYAVALTR